MACSAVRAQYRSLLLSLSGARTLSIVPATSDHWGATALCPHTSSHTTLHAIGGVRPWGAYLPEVACSAGRAQYRSLLLSLSGARTLDIVPATSDHWGATALPSDLFSYDFVHTTAVSGGA